MTPLPVIVLEDFRTRIIIRKEQIDPEPKMAKMEIQLSFLRQNWALPRSVIVWTQQDNMKMCDITRRNYLFERNLLRVYWSWCESTYRQMEPPNTAIYGDTLCFDKTMFWPKSSVWSPWFSAQISHFSSSVPTKFRAFSFRSHVKILYEIRHGQIQFYLHRL
jgi:hypothetical protein